MLEKGIGHDEYIGQITSCFKGYDGVLQYKGMTLSHMEQMIQI